jgi:hypothetical protein
MCSFFSAVITKGHKVHAFFNVDSHENIIEIAGLKETNTRNEVTLVRCELTPNSPMTLEFDKWDFRTDQDLLPPWYDAEKAHKAMIKYLKGVPTILEPANIIYENYYFAQAPIKIMLGRATIRFLMGSSQVGEMWGSSQVGEMRQSSQVGEMWQSSRVGTMRESSNVGTMRESSQVGTMWGSSRVGEMRESSRVGTMWESSRVGTMRESSKVGEMWQSSSAPRDPRKTKEPTK